MAMTGVLEMDRFTLAVVAASVAAIAIIYSYLFKRPSLPKNAPKLISEDWPIIGSLAFFTERWDFFQRQATHSSTGNFSFYAGRYPIIAVSGPEARKTFFDSKALSFTDGYGPLLGGAPDVSTSNTDKDSSDADSSDFGNYFNKRMTTLMKGPTLKTLHPKLLLDARQICDQLAETSITNPFDTIYRMVFLFTMRTVACNEIADDPVLLAKCLHHYESVDGTANPFCIMYPWLPLPSKFKRLYAGGQLYLIFKRIIEARAAAGRREQDALQHLIDQGDSIKDIITFVLGALFAGQLNSGINAAFILCYLASKPYWLAKVRAEVQAAADRHVAPAFAGEPLKERLMRLPLEAWEADFPITDLCLRDSMRLQMNGTAFRRNVSAHDVPIGKSGEVIPAGAFAILAAGEMHYSPDIYREPDEWDPARYLPGREEDKRQEYGWMGWGLGRHPCLGMRFAKLENNMIVAFFLAYFDDIKLADENGRETDRVPPANRNRYTAHKPDEVVYLKYKLAEY
ncbi:cytochrome P450 [Teratosphaeria nubilosa]|uniref:Cytochrome P450 n=1 Tax=Teratosphaeria nubilosa TaxID=161662 RepID=A0A6G1L9T2_9PEZI|nr:cytochrome P450 [Teratosphaeria nubilosa]